MKDNRPAPREQPVVQQAEAVAIVAAIRLLCQEFETGQYGLHIGIIHLARRLEKMTAKSGWWL